MNQHYFENLADLAVRIGVNIQENQELVINSPIECADFARTLAEKAYQAGARDVRINYSDEKFSKIRYTYAKEDALSDVPQWFVDKQNDVLTRGAAVISVYADDPDLLKGIDPIKIKTASTAIQQATADYHIGMMNNACRWCVVSVPTAGWARKVFPDLPEDAAIDALWDAIFKATRADQPDPVAAWHAFDKSFDEKVDFLNSHQFDHFIYKNNAGTDITVGMPDNYVFSGGSEAAQDGVVFFPNIPTEEVFCAPHRDRIDGTLVSSHPLVYNGQLIDHFSLTFTQGQVTGYQAEVGQDALKALIEAGEGANMLGEIAMVPYHSPISDMNLLFYNTLFDENASCHFALGAAYPSCIAGGTTMSEEALKAAGLNCSPVHEDFMVGTADLSITGVTKDGQAIPIFIDGDWAI